MEENDTQAERKEESKQRTGSGILLRSLIALIGLALIPGAVAGGLFLGMRASEGACVGNPLGVLIFPLMGFQLLVLVSIVRGNNRMVAFAVLLLVQFGLSYSCGGTYGFSKRRSVVSRQKTDLRAVAEAVDSYLAKTGAYPLSLSNLVEAGEWQGSDERLTRARYVSAPGGYLLWLEGSDGKWDLEPDGATEAQWADFASALQSADGASNPSWPLALMNATYDPTNGSRSSGDVFRYGPDAIANALSFMCGRSNIIPAQSGERASRPNSAASSGSSIAMQGNYLRITAEALDAYLSEHGAYPPTLQPFLRPDSLPTHSNYDSAAYLPRYATAGKRYVLWYPGVDEVWNIGEVNATQARLQIFLDHSEGDGLPRFALEVKYDPSNGTESAGDLLLFGPDNTKRSPSK